MKTIKGSVRIISISLALIVSGMLFPMLARASVHPDVVDFGEVVVGSSSTITLSVTNPNPTLEIDVSFSIVGGACGFAIDRREMSIPSGQRGLLQINYAPRDLGACSAILQVESTGSEVIPVPLRGIGVAANPAPPSTIVIRDFDTGIIDNLYDGQLISQWIADCADKAKNHGKFVSCVAHLTNELKREGIITEEEKDVIQGCVAQARIP